MSQKTSVPSGITPSAFNSEVAQIQLIIKAAMAGMRTSMPVSVVAVTNNGDLSAIGYVDLQPLVSTVDASGVAWEHGIIHNVPYMRIQGGANGIILDPVVGDIGIALVCDRDISTVKNTSAISRHWKAYSQSTLRPARLLRGWGQHGYPPTIWQTVLPILSSLSPRQCAWIICQNLAHGLLLPRITSSPMSPIPPPMARRGLQQSI